MFTNRVEEKIYQNVCKRMIAETQISQEKVNKKMAERLNGWEVYIRETIRTIINEEMTKFKEKNNED